MNQLAVAAEVSALGEALADWRARQPVHTWDEAIERRRAHDLELVDLCLELTEQDLAEHGLVSDRAEEPDVFERNMGV